MKILIIFTGGTIGSTVTDDYISPDGNKPYIILEKYNKMYPNNIEWDTVSPYTILSENVTLETYKKLAESVKEGLDKDYDGIIITHGSDTLQYSAAFLSLILGDDTIPVLLVSSNYVLEDARANGMDNFVAAVDFIQNNRGQGVFVPYKNSGENVKIHRGEKLMPHSLYSDYLSSMGNDFYGEYGDKGFVLSESDSDVKKTLPEPDYSQENTGICVIHACPGLVYPKLDEGIKSVLIHAYHGGTICGVDKGLKSFMESATKLQIPVYLVGVNPETEYESCKVYEELGIKLLGQISPIYAYIKLWFMPKS